MTARRRETVFGTDPGLQARMTGNSPAPSPRIGGEAALECTPVYALVPNKPLESTVRERARAFARRRRGPVEHSMLLEDQKVTPKNAEARLDEIVRETNPRLFWD